MQATELRNGRSLGGLPAPTGLRCPCSLLRHGTPTNSLATSPNPLTTRPWVKARDLARWINPIVRGWMQYFGAFYVSALHPLLERINAYLMRWMRK
ncbi:group II intron maturase-specific domain-containing protein [Streptomyces sp. NPDC059718]